MPNLKYAAYEPAGPHVGLVRGALGDLVDGEHFFDFVTDDLDYVVLYAFPGWPRVIQRRAALMAQFRVCPCCVSCGHTESRGPRDAVGVVAADATWPVEDRVAAVVILPHLHDGSDKVRATADWARSVTAACETPRCCHCPPGVPPAHTKPRPDRPRRSPRTPNLRGPPAPRTVRCGPGYGRHG